MSYRYSVVTVPAFGTFRGAQDSASIIMAAFWIMDLLLHPAVSAPVDLRQCAHLDLRIKLRRGI